MRYPIELKNKAIRLRKRGFSLGEISRKLKIAKGTASLWLNEIKLGTKAKKRLEEMSILKQYKTIFTKKAKREKLLKDLLIDSCRELGNISFNKELYRLLASVLFWCEGNKCSLSHVRFTNSDPEMIKIFLNLLRKGFKIEERKLRGLVHIHEYHDENKQIEFWSNITSIPRSQFNKSYRKPHTGKRINKGYQGCIAISYYDARVARKLWSYYKSLQNFF